MKTTTMNTATLSTNEYFEFLENLGAVWAGTIPTYEERRRGPMFFGGDCASRMGYVRDHLARLVRRDRPWPSTAL
jgi:hypothetical protein